MSEVCESCGFTECEGYCTEYHDDIIKHQQAEIERLNGLLVKIASIVNCAHFTTEELGNAD